MEDFVDFNLAKKLKEKGYPQVKKNTLAMYDEDGNLYSLAATVDEEYTDEEHRFEDFRDYDYVCPIISQVLTWLREEKKIHICVDVSYIVCKYGESIYKYRFYITNLSNHDRNTTLEDFDSFEECALAGINYALDYLIKN